MKQGGVGELFTEEQPQNLMLSVPSAVNAEHDGATIDDTTTSMQDTIAVEEPSTLDTAGLTASHLIVAHAEHAAAAEHANEMEQLLAELQAE